MDRSVDPCADFYHYACGSWIKSNPIPADESYWGVYSKLADENQRLLWGILEKLRTQASRTANEAKIGDLFNACMNEKTVNDLDAKPLEQDLARIAALPRVDSIADYIASEHRTGIDSSVLFVFSSDQDLDNASSMIASISPGGLGLPDRDYYTKTDVKSQEIRDRYRQHVAHMLGMIGESSSDADADAGTVLAIETALAQASLTRVDRRNPYNLRHKTTLGDLRTSTPSFDWDQYLKQRSVPVFTRVNVEEPKFLDAVNRLLKEQPLRAWRAYLRWHLIRSRAPYLSTRFVSENFNFYQAYLRGTQEEPARWKRCTRLVDDQLPDALGQVFVAQTFSPQTKTDAQRMTSQIEDEMRLDLKTLSWMSDATRAKALEKLSAIVNKIGYPDRWRDYSSVEVKPDTYMADVAATNAFRSRRDIEKIGKPVDRSEWHISPPTVNAYYSPQMNDINFPAGILQPPLFDPKTDAAPNFGDTGSTIGHELTHGFDDEGRQFDAAGNLKNWWTDADAKTFEQRTQCVRDQYAGYTIIDDVHINSGLTSGEDVADLGGTLLGYLAWKRATAGQTLTDKDGLTPDQRYFVGMAQWACSDQRQENARMRATVDPHSPDIYRVNGVVSDIPAFASAFGCKPSAPMVRANACRVW